MVKYTDRNYFLFNPHPTDHNNCRFNPLTAGVAYIRDFIFYQHIKYHLSNMLKMKYDINQQYLKTVDIHFVKSEQFSLT